MRVQPKSQKSPSGRRAWFYQYRTPQGRQTRVKLGDFRGMSAPRAFGLASKPLRRSSSTATSPGPERASRAQQFNSRASATTSSPITRCRPSPFTTAEPWRGSSRPILSRTCRVTSVMDLLSRRRSCVNTKSPCTVLPAGLESKLSVIDRATGIQICGGKELQSEDPPLAPFGRFSKGR